MGRDAIAAVEVFARRAAGAGSLSVMLLLSCAHPEGMPPQEQIPVFQITARGLSFEAPARVSAGWTRMHLKNESGMVHFALLQRLPEGIGVAEHQAQVAPVFQSGMNLMNAGARESGFEEFARLPSWYRNVEFLGGPGLVSPGRSTEVTLNLEPGTYLLECYVKTGGVFHSFSRSGEIYGMVHEFEVTKDRSRFSEPSADSRILIDSELGIQVQGRLLPGSQTIAVSYLQQSVHENAVGHDVHLVRLENGAELPALARWMDWTQRGGLETPAPATFIGGVNEMPAGSTAYLHVNLVPGRYAWISEVPHPDRKGLVKSFEVF